MNKNPQFTPYKSTKDLIELRDLFYNTDVEDGRSKAVAKVAAYLTRGYLPHSIEATSLLTSIILNDEDKELKDNTVLQLAYNMAIIKFVNGLLDPHQQSAFAIPLHTLANFLKLPSYFVEIRHCGTHEFLPSIDMLRLVGKSLLDWLYEHYWLEIDNLELGTSNDAHAKGEISQEESARISSEIKLQIKNYRRVRKLNLNKYYKFGDSTELGSAYWKAVNSLKQLYEANPDLFINTLILNRVMIMDSKLSEGKRNGLRLLYKPLIEELGHKFRMNFLEKLVSFQNQGVSEDGLKSVDEIEQSIGWCQYLLFDEITHYSNQKILLTKDTFSDIVNVLRSTNNRINVSLLEYLLDKQQLDSDQRKQVEDVLVLMKKFQVEDVSLAKSMNATKRPAEVLSDLTMDLENLRKRMKLAKNTERKDLQKKTVILWEICNEWKPIAFGECL